MTEYPSQRQELMPEERDRRSDTQYFELGPFSWRLTMRSAAWRPPTDLYETEQAYVVRVEIAGMREDDFHIELNGRLLSIRGARQDQSERRAYHQMEIHFGEFAIDLELPQHIEVTGIEAVYTNGFLRVSLPKARPRQVSITE
jgi:HSP20 family protein